MHPPQGDTKQISPLERFLRHKSSVTCLARHLCLKKKPTLQSRPMVPAQFVGGWLRRTGFSLKKQTGPAEINFILEKEDEEIEKRTMPIAVATEPGNLKASIGREMVRVL